MLADLAVLAWFGKWRRGLTRGQPDWGNEQREDQRQTDSRRIGRTSDTDVAADYPSNHAGMWPGGA